MGFLYRARLTTTELLGVRGQLVREQETKKRG